MKKPQNLNRRTEPFLFFSFLWVGQNKFEKFKTK